ncbi:helix-turn-helix transcriptional regulator [Bacteroides reticulotermitis]|uniref:helix-turn-helix transcriptional regulator n=1 Tax=Bacteroides reticulotermitis TaxID=1133319 RepID=UPI003A835BBB
MELQADNKLTRRENQIAGLAFCGKAKKEIADILDIAYGTVNVTLDKAYKKTGTSKLNELGSWWANRVFALGIDFKQLQKTIITLCFLGLIIFQISFDNDNNFYCIRRGRARRYKTEEIFYPNNQAA